MMRLFKAICSKFLQSTRVFFYSFISTINVNVKKHQPVIFSGKGRIIIDQSVIFGVKCSPGYYSGYGYIEARGPDSFIEIGEKTIINNNSVIISDGRRIIIGSECLIGCNLQILDSNFHDLRPEMRFGGKDIKKDDVLIGKNIFIGNNVTVLKGVTIGNNAVIANGSVVVKSVPENSVVGGNPAKVINYL